MIFATRIFERGARSSPVSQGQLPVLGPGYQTTSPGTQVVDIYGRVSQVFEVWDASITYRNYDLVIGSDSVPYQSKQSGNINHDPTTDVSETYWRPYSIPRPGTADTQTLYWDAASSQWKPSSFLRNSNTQVSIGGAPADANTEFTVKGTGGNAAPTLAQFIESTSGANAASIAVGNAATSKGVEMGLVGASDDYFTGTVQNDAVFRQSGGSGAVWLGVAATPFLKGTTTLLQPQVAFAQKVVTVTPSANTYTINAALGNQFRCTLAATNTIAAPTNPTDGQRILIEIIQDGTGSRTVTWNAAFVFGTDVPSPTLSTGVGKKDYVGFVYNSNSAKWHALAVSRGF